MDGDRNLFGLLARQCLNDRLALPVADGARAAAGPALHFLEFGHDDLRIQPVLHDTRQDVGQLPAKGFGDAARAADQNAALGLRQKQPRS